MPQPPSFIASPLHGEEVPTCEVELVMCKMA